MERKGGPYLVNNEELLAVHIHLKDDTAHLSAERRLRPRSHEHLSFKATWRRWREKGGDGGKNAAMMGMEGCKGGGVDDAAPTQKAQAAKRLDAQAHLLRAVNGWPGSEGPGEVGGS